MAIDSWATENQELLSITPTAIKLRNLSGETTSEVPISDAITIDTDIHGGFHGKRLAVVSVLYLGLCLSYGWLLPVDTFTSEQVGLSFGVLILLGYLSLVAPDSFYHTPHTLVIEFIDTRRDESLEAKIPLSDSASIDIALAKALEYGEFDSEPVDDHSTAEAS